MHARPHGTNGGLPQLPSSQICLIWAFRECNFPSEDFTALPELPRVSGKGSWYKQG